MFAARNAGLRSIYNLCRQYPHHVEVASRCATAICRLLNTTTHCDESSDSDTEHLESVDDELLVDTLVVLLRRMESYADDIQMQRWGIRAGSCILHLLYPDATNVSGTALPVKLIVMYVRYCLGLHSLTVSYVQLALIAMARFNTHHGIVQWGSEALALLLTHQSTNNYLISSRLCEITYDATQDQVVSVLAERGGIDILIDGMRQNVDNFEINRWAGQVILLSMFYDGMPLLLTFIVMELLVVTLQHTARQEGLYLHCEKILKLEEIQDLGRQNFKVFLNDINVMS